ncbi:ankyrin repeat-containing protein At2g01680-like [Cornus florida]|uniref:ankyrin repeat-containing protein At2g01680-like n=1 Tax=Cornus florida TaxID=4283 RepID=UPI00289DCE67|nr:ankyrin repeat-containing protein At2g01680-like [Cornus florida]
MFGNSFAFHGSNPRDNNIADTVIEEDASMYRDRYLGKDNENGLTALHVACGEGDVEVVRRLIHTSSIPCFSTDKCGGTPLHTAAMNGRLDVVKALLDACPESVKEVTATGRTCLHVAVMYNKGTVVCYIVKWLHTRKDYAYLIDEKDFVGNTVLHLATSRKQLQTLKVLLTYDPTIRSLVDVNTLNSGSFTALDILDVLPYEGKIDMEIDKILRRAGALRARDLAKHDTNHDAVYNSIKDQFHKYSHNTIKNIIEPPRESTNALLLVATMVATITFAALHVLPTSLLKQGYAYNYDVNGFPQLKNQDSIIIGSFILLNSTGFVASVALIIFLLYEFPLKPWPQISISTLFGSYMCSIMAISPGETMALFFLVIPIFILAAAGKFYGFTRQGS